MAKTNKSSTQQHLRFGEVRENTLILKNGGLRAILKTNSINFNLKSEDEREAIIRSYQAFLNSLEFPVQILIRSQKLEIDDYIDKIREIGDKQKNELLKKQTLEYADYIKRLIEYADIMQKEFYVVIPYTPGGEAQVTKLQGFFQRLAPKDTYQEMIKRSKSFENAKKILNQRVAVVKNGLENCGLQISELNTSEIVELMYKSYNPVSSISTKIKGYENSQIEKDSDKQYQV
jgi:type IV secretory pathway VirB4 component